MVKSRFERKVLVSSDEEDEEKFSADETGTKVPILKECHFGKVKL